MMVGKPDIDIVANADDSGIRVTYSGGHTVTVVRDEVVANTDPEKHEHDSGPDMWMEGRLAVDCYAPNPPQSWATGYCWLETRTDDGEWKQVELYVGDPEVDGHPLDGHTATYDVTRLEAVERPEEAD